MKVSIQDIKDMINGGMIARAYDLETFMESWNFKPFEIQAMQTYLKEAN